MTVVYKYLVQFLKTYRIHEIEIIQNIFSEQEHLSFQKEQKRLQV